MIVLALIILVLALLLTVAVLTGNDESFVVELFGSDVGTSVAGLYVTGLLVGFATLLALVLFRAGVKKSWRQRRHVKELERRAELADGQTLASGRDAASDGFGSETESQPLGGGDARKAADDES